MRFVVRMRKTESVRVAIQNVSAHQSDRKFQGVRHYRRVFPTFHKWRTSGVARGQRGFDIVIEDRNTVAGITNISSRCCCRKRISPHPAVDVDDCRMRKSLPSTLKVHLARLPACLSALNPHIQRVNHHVALFK